MEAESKAPGLSPESFSSHNWRDVLDELTEDMDPWSIDIVELADRYRSYLKEAEDTDLKVPARMILTCSILLRMKVNLMQDFKEQQPRERGMEEQHWDEAVEEEEPLDLEVPSDTVEPPVKKKKQPRKVTLDELKGALEKAIDIQKQRRQRHEERIEEEFIDLEENNIEDKLDELMERLEDYFDEETAVEFQKILEQKDREEKIEKFIHVLHLETDGKIRCEQDQFFGKIQILPEEN